MSTTALSKMAFDGGTKVTTGTNIILTASSPSIQHISATVNGLSVTLPDATTLVIGTTYQFRAVLNGYSIFDNNGGYIAAIATQSITMYVIQLLDNTTTYGTWTINSVYMPNNISQLTSLTLDGGYYATGIGSIQALSSTQAVAMTSYTDNDTVYQTEVDLVSYNSSTNTLSLLSSAICNGVNDSFVYLSKPSATLLFCSSGTYIYAAGVSGGTISVLASPATMPAPTSHSGITSTQSIATYYGGSNVLACAVLGWTGAAVTVGTVANINATGINMPIVAAMSSTSAICIYIGTSNFVYAIVLNISGTTVTAGSPIQVSTMVASPGSYPSIVSVSSTVAVASFMQSGGVMQVMPISISGTTITVGSGYLIGITNGNSAYPLYSTLLSSNTILHTNYQGSALTDLNGTTATFASSAGSVQLNTTSGIATLTPSLAIGLDGVSTAVSVFSITASR